MDKIADYREPGRGLMFWWLDRLLILAIAVFLWSVTHLFYRVTVHGKDNVPKGGRILFLVNHPSYFGIFATIFAVFWPWVLGRRMDMIPVIIAKEKYVNVPLWRWLLLHFNVLSLPEQKEIRSQIVKRQVWLLTQLRSCAHWIYPEGTRTEQDQHLGQFRPGVGRVVAEARPQVVFVYDYGSGQVWPKGRTLPRLPIRWFGPIPLPRRFPLEIRIFHPIDANDKKTGLYQVCQSVSLEESGEPVAGYLRDLMWWGVTSFYPQLAQVEPASKRIFWEDWRTITS